MKHVRVNLSGRILLAVVVLCTACNKNEMTENRPFGKLDLELGISVATHEVYNRIKAADPDEFKITIYSQSGEALHSFERAADMPDVIELEEGTYYVTANSGNNLPAAFENAYYEGRSDIFQIEGGSTTNVSVTCTLANIMVTVIYDQNVIDDFTGYNTTVANDEGSLVFGMNETRAGYFGQGPLQIEAVLQYNDGSGASQSIQLNGSITSPEAGRHYEIHINAGLNQGSAAINLSVDESYETTFVSVHEGLGYGDLLITEIMFNPSALSDSEGEWIEVFNNSDESINIRDLVIRRGSNNSLHKISTDVIIPSGEYAVLGRTANATENVDYVYSTISLSNSGEELIINTYGTNGIDGEVICSVDYGSEGFTTSLDGSSLQLNSGITDVSAAMLGTNWCASSISYNTGDLGTPGTSNSRCQ